MELMRRYSYSKLTNFFDNDSALSDDNNVRLFPSINNFKFNDSMASVDSFSGTSQQIPFKYFNCDHLGFFRVLYEDTKCIIKHLNCFRSYNVFKFEIY